MSFFTHKELIPMSATQKKPAKKVKNPKAKKDRAAKLTVEELALVTGAGGYDNSEVL
jgi:hypothetical protein